MTAAELAARLGARRSGSGWLARCPAHDDRTPSLSITEASDGRVLLKCHAGCSFDSIAKALELDSRALMGPSGRNGGRPIGKSKPDPGTKDQLAEALGKVCPLPGSPGAEYMRSRGFELSECLCTRFTPDLCGRPAVCWPIDDYEGRRVALHGRHTDGRDNPKAHTVGALKDGVFWLPGTDACRDASELAILEAPLDALAMHHATRLPCAALCGTTVRPWLVEHLRGKVVFLAFDADQAGEKAAREWAQALRQSGVKTLRLRPPDGFKDFAEAYEKLGKDGLRDRMPVPQQIVGAGTPEIDAWAEPEPLAGVPDPMPFPTDALPAPIRAFVEATAEHTQAPPDLPALLALGALATACARTARIEGAPGWTEPLNVFSCIALPSGSRKSAVVSACVAPIEIFECEELERLRPAIAAHAAKRATLEERLKTLTRKAALARTDGRQAADADRDEAARELAELPEEHMPRLLADDATPECLARLMAEQHGRIACLSAEGSMLFAHAAGRYADGGGARLETYLKAHAGDTLRVDRVGRRSDYVREPALTLCLTVQPSVLTGAMSTPDVRGRGLLARFIWSVPKPTIGYRRQITDPVPDYVRTAYADCLRRPLRRTPADDPPTQRLSSDAARAFHDFCERNERDLRPEGRLGHVTDWGSKLPGLVLRIAGLLHLVCHTDSEPVGLDTIEAACKIGEYAAQHALIAFGMMGADPLRAKAERLLAWIRKNKKPEVSARDAYHENRAHFARPGDVAPALDLLVEYGYLRELDRCGGPGRPSRRFAVNPLILGQNAQNAQNPDRCPNIGHFGHFVHGCSDQSASSACPNCGEPTSATGTLCPSCDPFDDATENLEP